jgi:hypothetical protein
MFGLQFNGEVVTDLMVQPGRIRLQGHIAYRFIFGGFLWAYVVSSHPIPKILERAFLQPSGSSLFLVKDANTAANLVGFGQELMRLSRL